MRAEELAGGTRVRVTAPNGAHVDTETWCRPHELAPAVYVLALPEGIAAAVVCRSEPDARHPHPPAFLVPLTWITVTDRRLA
jgi:hypothetical protein